jgi:hypothetical protein
MIEIIEKRELIQNYVEHIVDGMYWDTLVSFVRCTLTESLELKTLQDIQEEVNQHAPHLLD